MRRVKNNETGECYYVDSMGLSSQTGEGIFDIITSVLGKAAIKTSAVGSKVAANETAKKLASVALEKAGQKGSEMLTDKIALSIVKRIENNLKNKGNQIVEELKKLQKTPPTESKKGSVVSSISDEFDKLINT